jgi:NAD(P)-dependent dehydrogenase (short-subunit alcohol dehydrogenase family)
MGRSTPIAGATAVVTGGRRGLGRAIVDSLLANGAATVYATSRQPEPWDDPRVVSLAVDVTDDASVADLADRADGATIVVNNAGLLGGQSLLTSPMSDIRAVMETNFFGSLRVTRALAPAFAERGGTVVDIASVLSWLPTSGAYGCSKAAVWSATNSLRIELTPNDIHVVGVYLGYTDTDMVADLEVDKNDPADVARQIVEAITSGADEVLADDFTRRARASVFA